MKIADILRHKGSTVVTIGPDRTIRELLAELAEHNIGAVLVTDGVGDTQRVLGIASERDMVRRLHTAGPAALDGSVGDLMTAQVIACAPGDSINTVAGAMTERRVRHMPVLDHGRLVGIVSIGDVVSSRIGQLEQDSRQLEQYITG